MYGLGFGSFYTNIYDISLFIVPFLNSNNCCLYALFTMMYCKSGNVRATFIFALFTLQPGLRENKSARICSICA